MSGFCSAHQGHDPECEQCNLVPLTDEEKAFYQGWNEALEAQRLNCWTPVENCVLNVYTRLEDAARSCGSPTPELEKVLDEIYELRKLNRGLWGRNLKT